MKGKSAEGNSPKAGKLMSGSKNVASTSMAAPPKLRAQMYSGNGLIGKPKRGC